MATHTLEITLLTWGLLKKWAGKFKIPEDERMVEFCERWLQDDALSSSSEAAHEKRTKTRCA